MTGPVFFSPSTAARGQLWRRRGRSCVSLRPRHTVLPEHNRVCCVSPQNSPVLVSSRPSPSGAAQPGQSCARGSSKWPHNSHLRRQSCNGKSKPSLTSPTNCNAPAVPAASTGERIAAAFVLNRMDYLPANYRDVVEAWERLDDWQRYVQDVKARYMHLIEGH